MSSLCAQLVIVNDSPVYGFNPKPTRFSFAKAFLSRVKTRVTNAAKREDGTLIKNEVLGRRLRESLSERVY